MSSIVLCLLSISGILCHSLDIHSSYIGHELHSVLQSVAVLQVVVIIYPCFSYLSNEARSLEENLK